jgi:hypothetical protein
VVRYIELCVDRISDGRDECAFCGKPIPRNERALRYLFTDGSDFYTYHPACHLQMEDDLAVSVATHQLLG